MGEKTSRLRLPRRGIVSLVVLALLGTAAGLYIPASLNAPLDAGVISIEAPRAAPTTAAALSMPTLGSSLVTISGPEEFAAMTGAAELSAAAGGNDPRPIASITKLITALVILEAKPLAAGEAGPTISFTKADVDLYEKYYVMDATIHSMKPGSSLSQREALEVMLIGSAANYAEAVSTWAFGSQASYRAAVRNWLDSRGLTATRIVEPTGIDPRNVSTPSELVAIGRLAAADPVIAEIVQMPQLHVVGHAADPNTNGMLGWRGVNGLKSGTLDGHGSNLLYTSQLDAGLSEPLTVIGVSLGSFDAASLYREVVTLLDSISGGFHEVEIVEKDAVLGTVTTAWGETAEVRAGSDGSILTWSDTAVTPKVTTGDIAHGEKGDRVGTITYAAGPVTEEVELELGGPIEAPSAWWRLTHPGEVLGW